MARYPDQPDSPAQPDKMGFGAQDFGVSADLPETIGPYRVLEILGEGGMGMVYLAEQTEPVKRRVALKVIKPGMDSRQIIARFEAERQALAVMDHPNIATVFEGGVTEAGRPYFAMELVQGPSITDYCDQQRLSIRDRLQLFIPVCLAVQHAHQKGVIHRDLKPSNIPVTLLDGKPLPKVIDFGIAKAVGQRLCEETLLTQTGHLIGTPAYMSPEQAEMSGLDIDTRTDIYSLGVVLYQLLVGELPFDSNELQGLAALYTLLEKEPPTPSARFKTLGERRNTVADHRRTDPSTHDRRLKGDLGWITMRAMEKDRSRRYVTANSLASDIQRYLDHQPVIARAPSAAYRFGKFIRRHRVGVAAGTVVALALLISSVAVAVLAVEATRARNDADRRRLQAEDLISFMVGDLQNKLQPIGRLDVLDDVGDKALDYFASVPAEQLTDEELFRRSQAMSQIGAVRVAQGNLPAAREAFEESLALALGLADRDARNDEWQLGLAAAHFWLGYAQWRSGDLDTALQQFQRYLSVAQDNLSRDTSSLDWQLEVGYAHSNIGFVLQGRGDLEGALRAFETNMAIEQKLVARDPSNDQWQLDLANSHNTVGDIQVSQGELSDALDNFRQEVSIKSMLVRRDPANATWWQELAKAHNYLGGVLEVRGDLGGAIEQFREAVTILQRLVANDSTNVAWQRALATNRSRVGLSLLKRGERGPALQLFRDVEAMALATAAQDPTDPRYQRDLAQTHDRIGSALLASGDVEGAIARCVIANEILERLLQQNPEDREARRLLAESLNLYGAALSRRGDAEAAAASWGRVVEIIGDLAQGSNDWRLLEPWTRALLELNRVEEARASVMRLQEIGFVDPDFQKLSEQKGLRFPVR